MIASSSALLGFVCLATHHGRGARSKMEQREESTSTIPATSSSKNSSVCPICLDRVKQEAYLDRCFHTFCYHCIANWTKYVSRQHSQPLTSIRCPLCKSENSSIIYGLSGNFFQRHYVNRDPESSFLTEAHQLRGQCYEIECGVIRHKFDVLSYWKNRRHLQQNKFLQTWLRREIQTLLQEEDVEIIVLHMLGMIDSFLRRLQQEHLKFPPEEKQREFKQLLSDAARPFISGRTDRFVEELELFLASSLNIEAYDKVYMECLHIHALAPRMDYTEDEHEQALGDPRLHFFDEDLDKTC